jgi:hypothetical protein
MIRDLSGEENTLTKWMGAVDADLPPCGRSPPGCVGTWTPSSLG